MFHPIPFSTPWLCTLMIRSLLLPLHSFRAWLKRSSNRIWCSRHLVTCTSIPKLPLSLTELAGIVGSKSIEPHLAARYSSPEPPVCLAPCPANQCLPTISANFRQQLLPCVGEYSATAGLKRCSRASS
ncbi:hypothetical protein NA56DRAFT_642506 [Hyaloscypha hepaticicola]|uniref:Secreted protein n=1 Tax=Hyaloscypha hepaticicola TaxID=2082293 RepID=A0A2J6QGZ8_9HELO|nr:hypothetical protein NA56DRAFT_642506 [Hyaloscypha hepaticicola]